ncbi:hypothetical protein ONZ45_g16655 [Pleurotus djamor]|nr:hypothetical protein ONZ45_g16655 [Pleurotus djamor]
MTLETAITEQFKSDNLEAPLWRFTVTSSNYVILVYHHLLGDGQSGLAVLRTVVEALNSPPDLSESTTVVAPSASLELIPNIENRIKVSPSFGVVFRAVLDQLLPGWLTRDIWTGNNVVERLPPPPNWIGTRLRLIALPPAATSELVARARSHKTTVTSILHYIGVLALSHLITHPRHAATISSDGKEATKSPYKRVSVGIPVSLRLQAGIPPTQMYEAASSITQIETLIPTHSLSFPCCAGECESTSNWVETFPWRAAAKLSQTLKSSGPRARSELGLLKFVDGKFEEFWKGKLGKKRSATLEVSNVGVWSFGSHGRNADAGKDAGTEATPLPTDTRWGVSSAYFAQDDNVVGSALKLNAIGSPSGELNVCVTWGEGSVDEEFAETFAKLVGHVLNELSKA